MAAITAKFNQALFMEEVQRYECIYHKFSKDYKNNYIRLNSWKAIAEVYYILIKEKYISYRRNILYLLSASGCPWGREKI